MEDKETITQEISIETITQEISIPEGCVLDEEKSTLLHLVFKKKQPAVVCWKDLPEVHGYRYGQNGQVVYTPPAYINPSSTNDGYKDLAADPKVVRHSVAAAQISQLKKYYGGDVTLEDWQDMHQVIYIITYNHLANQFSIEPSYFMQETSGLLAFHTEEQASNFLLNNEDLVKDYLMLPKTIVVCRSRGQHYMPL